MRYLLKIFFFFTILIYGCKNAADEVPEKGVSYALNVHRKNVLDSIQYAIELDIPQEKKESIKGKESISFVLDSLESPLILDFSAESKQLLSIKSKGKSVEYTFENEHIIVPASELEKGRNIFEIDFIAGDLSLNRSEEFLYTLFVPDRASTCFPLFDQPNLKANYAVTLKTPVGWEAVSNGSLVKKALENGKNVYEFSKTKPISSYLFAFAAGKFFKAEKIISGRAMTMYYRETDSVKVDRNRDEVFNLHSKSLDWLENYTKILYPFDKFDFVLLPSFQYGGMEHPGSIFYNESALFLDENASVNKRMARASVIAHESAHMWFGDLVTMDWFNDVWLKEVFANFMAAKIVHPSFPEINHNLRFLLAHYPSAYDVDRSSGTNPILQKLENLKNAGTLYGAIIYQKAPIVMRQLERKIGEKLMQESLQEYLKTFSFGNARWDDLIGIIDKKTPLDITDWSNVWVKTPDMPEYEFSIEKDILKVSQKADSVSGRTWQQPVLLRWLEDGKYKDTSLLFASTSSKLINLGTGKLIFPNADGAAYGYFKMDTASINYLISKYNQSGDSSQANPVFRGAMLVNEWEKLIRDEFASPELFLNSLSEILPKEQNPLLTDYLLGNLQEVWWTFLSPQQRAERQQKLEIQLWDLMVKTPDKGIKTSYFRAFKSVVFTTVGLLKLRSLWDGSLAVKDLVLSEEDKISIAYELALKGNDGKAVLEKQLSDTKNPDRKARMKFVIPSLSYDEKERDAFFESLKKPENREKEAWVLDAITYLHHPLRQKSALKYIRPSLELLQEIQLTGDIFFPTRWTYGTFSGHSSAEAAAIAKAFLKEHPDYPYFLKNKILQSTDMLNRAVRLRKMTVAIQ
jgi:aminopeptidase N